MLPWLIDTHCHFEPEDDSAALLSEAARAYVQVLAVGGSPALNASAEAAGTAFAQGYDWSWEAPTPPPALTLKPGLVAIGELGFDLHYAQGRAVEARQQALFYPQADFARTHHLPVIIHTREADELTLDALRSVDLPQTGVIHSFTGSYPFAKRLLDLGYFISFSGILTFRNATALREVARALPLDRLLVETDCPYLAPVPLRGRRNRPAYIRETAVALAALRGLSPEALAEQTTQNARQLFPLLPVPPIHPGDCTHG